MTYEGHEKENGTGYFSDAFNGRPRLLSVDSNPNAAAKERAEPYTKIVEELPQMRREAVQLVRQAVGMGRRAYVLVNNRAEGNAPLTVEALAGEFTQRVSVGP